MKVSLDKRQKHHVIRFWHAIHDDEIQRLFPSSIHSLDEALSMFEASERDMTNSYGRVIYCDDIYIGDVWAYSIDEDHENHAMLSIVIFDKAFWDRGIGTQALQNFISVIFDKYKVDRIGAFTFTSNQGSIKMLKKSGFELKDSFIEKDVQSYYFEISKINCS